MKYESVLLIGGPRDGEWISVLEGICEIRLSSAPTCKSYAETNHRESVESLMLEYRRVPFQSDRGFKGAVFIFGDIDPMVALINGYRKA